MLFALIHMFPSFSVDADDEVILFRTQLLASPSAFRVISIIQTYGPQIVILYRPWVIKAFSLIIKTYFNGPDEKV